MTERVVVAMSGGVDSSVAAALITRAGFDAVGVTLKLMPKLESSFGCCGSPRDVDDAKRVCESLEIPHYVLDMSELFEQRVIDPFVQSYLNSQTPNPCVECNRSVKFGYLLRLMDAWRARYVATGHYARVKNGKLYKAIDSQKDQTYFLHSLTKDVLDRVLFPVGDLEKPEVRRIARELGLVTAEKPESQEICFVPDRDYRTFIRSRMLSLDHLPGREENTGEATSKEYDLSRGPLRISPQGGYVRNSDGKILGTHQGTENFTVGQRRGLGISSNEPLYVTRVDALSQTVFVGPDSETLSPGLIAQDISWTDRAPEQSIEIEARIRHRHSPAAAVLAPQDDGSVRVEFAEAQRAVTPGQAVVFYRGEEVLGGGTIRASLPSKGLKNPIREFSLGSV